MLVDNDKVARDADFAKEVIAFSFDDVAASVTDGLRGSYQPGYAFEIVGVQHFVRDITANFSYMVKVGTTDALSAAAVPADAARGDAALHATLANLRGDEDAEINLHLTSDGSGAADEGVVYVTIRARGLRGDPLTP